MLNNSFHVTNTKNDIFYKVYGKFRGFFFVNPQFATPKQCTFLEIDPS